MPLIHDHPLALLLHLLRAHLQRPHETDLLLALRPHGHHLPRLQRVLRVGQPPAGGGQPGRHERRAGQDEADRAAVDLHGGQGVGELVQQAEVRDERGVIVGGLVEEGVGVDRVEGCVVGTVSTNTNGNVSQRLASKKKKKTKSGGMEKEGDVQLHSIELGLLGQDLVDVRLEARVRLDELCAQAALDGRLDLGAGAGCDSISRKFP